MCSLLYRKSVRTHPELTFREISFAQNIHVSCLIVSTICSEHVNDTVVFYPKFKKKTILQPSNKL